MPYPPRKQPLILLKKFLFYPVYALLFLVTACSGDPPAETSEARISEHVEFLADSEMEGRLAGSIYEAEASNYIADHFLQYGVEPAGEGDTYLQTFTLSGPMVEAMDAEGRISRNVIGRVTGNEYPDRFVVIGAHYDGQGSGGVISMNHSGPEAVHPSADDNASGSAALMELARRFAENPAETSVLLIAFSGEELGLLGSRYFVDRSEIEPDSMLAMVNIDMIGKLEQNGELLIFGTGSSPAWEGLIEDPQAFEVSMPAGGLDASDHGPFYDEGIPVLHYHTGTHQAYHRPEDIAADVDMNGIGSIVDHVEQTVRSVAMLSPEEMEFTSTGERGRVQMRRDGVLLGVIPDYTWSGRGFRVDEVVEGEPADGAGMEDGDVIVVMKGVQVTDIYDYMRALNRVEEGETVELQILWDGELIRLDVQF